MRRDIIVITRAPSLISMCVPLVTTALQVQVYLMLALKVHSHLPRVIMMLAIVSTVQQATTVKVYSIHNTHYLSVQCTVLLFTLAYFLLHTNL